MSHVFCEWTSLEGGKKDYVLSRHQKSLAFELLLCQLALQTGNSCHGGYGKAPSVGSETYRA